MTDSNTVEESIKYSIQKNGFPEKIVRLPFRPIYDACKKNGTSLTAVLNNLQKEKISGKIQENHIEFRCADKLEKPVDGTAAGKSGSSNFSWLKEKLSIAGFEKTAKEYLSKLSPDQIAEARKMAENMSVEEKMNLMKTFMQRFGKGGS